MLVGRGNRPAIEQRNFFVRDADPVQPSGRQYWGRRFAQVVSGTCAVGDPVHELKTLTELCEVSGAPSPDAGRWTVREGGMP